MKTPDLENDPAPMPQRAAGPPILEDRNIRLSILAEDDVLATSLVAFLAEQGVLAGRCAMLSDLLHGLLLDHRAPRVDIVILEARSMLGGALPRLSRIRRVSDVPCLVLGGDTDEVARVVLLEAGADDCVVTPVGPREILARIRALLRRRDPYGVRSAARPMVSSERPASPRPVPGTPRRDLGLGWYLCHLRRDLYRPDGARCMLTTAEFDLLDCLARSPGTPVSREEICRVVYRRRHWPDDRSVDNLIVRLRRKVETDPSRPEIVRSIRAVGYLFAGFLDPGTASGTPAASPPSGGVAAAS